MKSNLFNPFEISICGYSGLGKTTLIAKLIKELSDTFQVGYVKHDAHRFEMDKEGKDTFVATQNGAEGALIYSSNTGRMAWLSKKNPSQFSQLFVEFDLVLIEGLKGAVNLPKIVFLDPNSKVLEEVDPETVLLTVSPSERDDVQRVKDIILAHFKKKIAETPIYGLVLTGGYSKRMGKDKAFLKYSGKPQYLAAKEMLEPFCSKVFVSCRNEQVPFFDEVSTIPDTFLDMGPMGGILSAQKKYPNAAWVVVACDLPNLSSETLAFLIENRSPFRAFTAFQSTGDSLPEPLCAIYEPKSYSILLSFMGQNIICPRKAILNSRSCLKKLPNPDALMNVNTKDDLHSFQEKVKN